MAAHALTREYGSGQSVVHALRGLSIDVPARQFAAVMGALLTGGVLPPRLRRARRTAAG